MSVIERDSICVMADGSPPPFIIPFCASCDEPVELFTVYPSMVDGAFVAEASCHGQTRGIRISKVEAEWRLRTNNKLVLFQRRQGFDAVR